MKETFALECLILNGAHNHFEECLARMSGAWRVISQSH